MQPSVASTNEKKLQTCRGAAAWTAFCPKCVPDGGVTRIFEADSRHTVARFRIGTRNSTLHLLFTSGEGRRYMALSNHFAYACHRQIGESYCIMGMACINGMGWSHLVHSSESCASAQWKLESSACPAAKAIKLMACSQASYTMR